jgi:hypothetical protein
LDGLRVGDCVGGVGIGPVGTDSCACACLIKTQTPNVTAHPLSKSCASAIRVNLLVGIAASFEPIFLWARINV